LKIHIEYCGAWGYRPKASALKQTLEKEFGAKVSVEMEVGRSSSFEVTHGDDKKVIFSKLKENKFPDSKDVVDGVKKILG